MTGRERVCPSPQGSAAGLAVPSRWGRLAAAEPGTHPHAVTHMHTLSHTHVCCLPPVACTHGASLSPSPGSRENLTKLGDRRQIRGARGLRAIGKDPETARQGRTGGRAAHLLGLLHPARRPQTSRLWDARMTSQTHLPLPSSPHQGSPPHRRPSPHDPAYHG